MLTAPLSDKAMMSNSIVAFVLSHPEIKDPFVGYNMWTKETRDRDFPWGYPDTPAFYIHIFDVCINMERETLQELWEEEQYQLVKERET